jgi:hypothetical protein
MGDTGAIDMGKAGEGLIRFVGVEELEAKEAAKRAEEKRQNSLLTQGLATFLNKRWDKAKTDKSFTERKLLKAKRQRKGEYDPEDLQQIQQFGGSTIYMMITNVKCRAIESWVKDVMLPAGEKPWTIEPTPVADLPIEVEELIAVQVQKEARMMMLEAGPVVTMDDVNERMEEIREDIRKQMQTQAVKETIKMEDELEDDLVEGGFYDAFADFIKDFATYQTAFMKGPIIKMRDCLEWEINPATGQKMPVIKKVLKREWERVSPFDIYPGPSSKSLQDGYVCERMRLRPSALQAFRNVPGFKSTAIDLVLAYHRNGQLSNWLWTDQERALLDDRPNEQDDDVDQIQVVCYRGPIRGQDLIDWGMKDKLQPNFDYETEAWFVENYVLMARINKHPLKRRPLYGASFEMNPDSIWGLAPPEILEDCQRICNASARAIVNNMAIASGPQVEVHEDRVDPKEDIEDIYPWKVWKTKSDELGTGKQAVYFYQPNSMTKELMAVYAEFFKQAGEQLGVPAYEHGSPQVGGAGKTAHGLSMLMSASSKIMKDAIGNIDKTLMKPIIEELWLNKMTFDEEFNKRNRGDLEIVARASEYLVIAEQLQIRRAEFLQMTMNPFDMQILGMAGRAKILKEVLKTLKMPDEIIPEEQIDAMDINAGGPPVPGQGVNPGQPGGPIPAQPGEGLPNGAIPNEAMAGPGVLNPPANPGEPGGPPGGVLPTLQDPGRI